MDNLDDDLSAMAMIRALGPEYTEFASSFVCFDPTCSEVVQAFIRKHNYHLVVCRLMAGRQHSGTSWRAQCMSRLKKYMQSPNSPGEHSV
jgi:hypothetical protein